MKKAKKVLLLVLCAVLLVGATAAGTVAYLTDQDNEVTNTFTVGKVVIELDESLVDPYGESYLKQIPADKEGEDPTFEEVENVEDATRVTTNAYKLIPGHKYIKDPTIHVDDESESCWLFVEVDNQIAATLEWETGWTNIKVSGADTNYWKYENKVEPGADVTVFKSFTYSNEVTDTTTDAAKEITVKAYAIQADGLTTVDAAWDALGLNSTNP